MPVDRLALGALERRVIAHSGAAAAEWLAQLPDRIAALEARHGLVLQRPFPGLSHNYVAIAQRRGGDTVVAKLHRPDDPEACSERAALIAFDGRASARLLWHDVALSVGVLEHVRPGASVAALPDPAATDVAGALLIQLHQAPPPPEAIALWSWLGALWREAGGWGASGRRLAQQLLDTAPPPVLLHGDLHHANVLLGPEGYVSIDPKGLIGDPAFDAVMWLANALDVPDPAATLAARAIRLAEHLGCGPDRIVRWAVVQSLLSASWAVSGGVDPAGDLAHAALLQRVLGELRR